MAKASHLLKWPGFSKNCLWGRDENTQQVCSTFYTRKKTKAQKGTGIQGFSERSGFMTPHIRLLPIDKLLPFFQDSGSIHSGI